MSACGLPGNSPKAAISNYHKNLCDGDIDAVMKNLSVSVPVAPEMMELGLKSMYGECKEKGGFDFFETREENINGETAFVKGQVQYKNLTQESVNMKLYKEKGVWRITWQAPK